MKNKMILFLTAVSLAVATTSAVAQTNSPPPRKSIERTNTLKATVMNIDYNKRQITLRGPRGNLMTFEVSNDVKRFNNVKVGDEIWIGYYDAVALSVFKSDSALPATGSTTTRITREPGGKPAGTATSITDMTAVVEDVNREKHEVTLRGPGGGTVVVEVSPEVGNLQQINRGDHLVVSYTEALVISVEKPE